MRLESVTLKNVGRFNGDVSVGPLDSGLNVLSAGNEAGKSTLLMATARALFDRHNVTGEGITALQPIGTSLAPEVTVTFQSSHGRFQIHKRFLQSASAELREFKDGVWQAIADGDAADARVLELVAGTRAGRGASKPEHWGMLRHLWARQGEMTSWPDFQDDTGARVRTQLAGIEIDSLVETLIGSFERAADEQFTSTGRLKKNGPLAALEESIADQETELNDVHATMQRMDEQQQELATSRETLAVYRTSKADADQKVTALTAARRDVELLRKDLERFDETYASAEQNLAAIDKDQQSVAADQKALADAETEQQALADKAEAHQQKDIVLRAELATHKQQITGQQDAINEARLQEARLRDIASLAQQQTSVTALTKTLDKISASDQQQALLREQRAALPDVDGRTLKKMNSCEQVIRELGIRAEAVGLRVTLAPLADATVAVSGDEQDRAELKIAGGATEETGATWAMDLNIPEWGQISIVSGAEEATELEAEMSKQRATLSDLLSLHKVDSVAQALEASEQLKAIDREIKTASDAAAALLDDWDSLDALQQSFEKAKGAVAQLSTRLSLSKEETSLTAADLEAQLSTLQDALRCLDRSITALGNVIEKLEKQIEAVAADRAERSSAMDAIGKQIAGLNARLKTLLDRYPDGIEKAMEQAQIAFVTAKAEKAVATSKLPDDWEKIDQRHARALKAASQVADEYDALGQTISGLEAILKERGSQGLYSKETQLVESLEGNKKSATSMRSKATAARLLAALLDYRKKESVRTVLAPLEDQLSIAFTELTGDHSRRVTLDEDLHIAGIGRNRQEVIPFPQLSQGAKEQLLLALRAAVALELSKEEPQILILDDVLVNTDPVRQERVLDYLQQISTDVQILVLTCHASMYRGVGHAVGLNAGVAS